jgi:hypothetical protein
MERETIDKDTAAEIHDIRKSAEQILTAVTTFLNCYQIRRNAFEFRYMLLYTSRHALPQAFSYVRLFTYTTESPSWNIALSCAPTLH